MQFLPSFFAKIAENSKTSIILRNLRFFVNVFSEKSEKNANYRERLPKMFKTEFILANFAIFANVFWRYLVLGFAINGENG